MMVIHNVMMRTKWCVAVALVIIILMSIASLDKHQNYIPIDSEEVNYSNDLSESQINFNFYDGEIFASILDVNGTITNKEGNYSWKIVDVFNLDENNQPTEVLSGQYLDSITPVSDDTWEWTLSVNISGINCTCNLIIISTSDVQEVIDSSNILTYLGTNSYRPFIQYETLSSSKVDEYNYSLTFELIQPNEQSVSIELVNDESIFLDSKICQIRSNLCIGNWLNVVLNYSITEDIVSINIDQNELSIADGFWMFEIFVKDNFLRTSNTISHILIVDSNPPQVNLSSSSSIQESDSFLVYADVDDYFVGSPISLTWTITDPSGSTRGLFSDEFYHNYTIELTLNHSGKWDVHLLVRDSANFLVRENISIFVENVEPKIILDLDGLTVGQGDEIMINSGVPWVINASSSFDTVNDLDSLTFEWYVDEVKIDSDKQILTNLDVDIESSSNIMLIIYDDDQMSDDISFTISVSNIEEESISIGVVLFSGISISFVLIFIVMRLFFRKESSSFELPKWKSKN